MDYLLLYLKLLIAALSIFIFLTNISKPEEHSIDIAIGALALGLIAITIIMFIQ